jgi:excisionase family DNA binding protein
VSPTDLCELSLPTQAWIDEHWNGCVTAVACAATAPTGSLWPSVDTPVRSGRSGSMTQADASPLPVADLASDLRLLSPEAVSEILAVSRDHVFTLMRRGEIPYVRVGRFYRIAERDLATYVHARRVNRIDQTAVRVRLRVSDVSTADHR